MDAVLLHFFAAMHATNSDMMQPGLLQLQPSMDDMEFDPFQGRSILNDAINWLPIS